MDKNQYFAAYVWYDAQLRVHSIEVQYTFSLRECRAPNCHARYGSFQWFSPSLGWMDFTRSVRGVSVWVCDGISLCVWSLSLFLRLRATSGHLQVYSSTNILQPATPYKLQEHDSNTSHLCSSAHLLPSLEKHSCALSGLPEALQLGTPAALSQGAP